MNKKIFWIGAILVLLVVSIGVAEAGCFLGIFGKDCKTIGKNLREVDGGPGAREDVCGDGICNIGEDEINCPQDCQDDYENIIRANSCDRDNNCEMRAATIDNYINVGSISIKSSGIKATEIDTPLVLTSRSDEVRIEDNLLITGVITSSGDEVIIDDALSIKDSITIKGNGIKAMEIDTPLVLTSRSDEVRIEDNLFIMGLSGNGNAYACLDSSGRLFRSNNPCR